MNRLFRRWNAAAFAAALIFLSCAQLPRPAPSRFADSKPASPSAASPRPSPAESAVPEPRPALPAPAADYLAKLRAAFASQDSAFLLSQGEQSYQSAVRPGRSEESYLALLYRTGAYAIDAPEISAVPAPALRIRAVKDFMLIRWAERGPVVEAEGELLLSDGKKIPCAPILLWKALPPRILGLYP